MAVVFPHAVVGNRIDGCPDRRGFVCFGGSADVIIRAKDMTEDVRAIRHREPEFADLARVYGSDEKFFAGFADHAFERCFTGIDLAARAVDFTCAETALFFDQQDAAIVHDEHQRGVDAALPLGPIDW